MEKIWEQLEKWQNNLENKISIDTYIRICEQTDREIDLDQLPPDEADFPLDVQAGIMVFNKLKDDIVADVGYLGKDYTLIPYYMEIYEVTNKELFLETISRLEARVRKRTSEDMQRARKALKSKG